MKKFYTFEEINSAMRNDPEGFVITCSNKYKDKINEAVEHITANPSIDIIMLAGPSSSGKTTTANKLVEGLIKKGVNAHKVSLDDFYLDRDNIPINSDGLPDYENITALDIPLIKSTFESLIKKREAVLPVFDFVTGKRAEEGCFVELGKKDVVVVEGIHALNPIMMYNDDSSHVYKIYINASSRLVTVNTGRVLLTKRDIRLIRRIVRDYNFRASSVENTFFLWSGVRKGEDEFIFPYKNQADFHINTFHPFEPCLFRSEVVELLSGFDENSIYIDEALRLVSSIERFDDMPDMYLPEDSLMREFVKLSD